MDDDKDEFGYGIGKCVSPDYFDVGNDIPDVSSYEDYEHLKAKQRASVLWILSKAYNNEIPSEFHDPYYKDNDDQDRLKPQIVQSLANTEIYCLALSNIYADPNYSCLNHHEIMQLLMRKGIYVVEPNDTSLTETVLVQTAPIRMSAHMVIIEAIMALYIKEVLISEKIVEVVNRFMPIDQEEELPTEPEEAALFWINKSCEKMKLRIEEELSHLGNQPNLVSPPLAFLEDLSDLSDGCSLAAVLSFYCPDQLKWTEICFNESMGMADSIYNLQLVQYFCQEKLPYNICFLNLEDFLYLHETIRPNILAFIADLLYLFEIKPCPVVRRPGTKEELGYCDFEDEPIRRLPDLPTPAEMKSKSLQHSGWADSNYGDSKYEEKPRRSLHRNSSYDPSDEDDLTRYFSALDLDAGGDSSPDVIIANSGPQSLIATTTYLDGKPYQKVSISKLSKPSSRRKSRENRSNPSPTRSERSESNFDYYSQLEGDKQFSSSNKTSFAKLSKCKDANNFQKDEASESQIHAPTINIAFKQKSEKDLNHTRQVVSSSPRNSSQRTLSQLNDSSSIKECLLQQKIELSKIQSQGEESQTDNDVQSLLHNIRLKLEAKRHKLDEENKSVSEAWKQQALLKAVKSQKDGEKESKSEFMKEISRINGSRKSSSQSEESIDVSELKQDIEEIKKKFLEHEKAARKRSSSNSLDGDLERNVTADSLTTSIDELETSAVQRHQDSSSNKFDERQQSFHIHCETGFSLHPERIPSSSSSEILYHHSSDNLRYENSQGMHNRPIIPGTSEQQAMTISKRGKWGQPVVPVPATQSDLQWTMAPVPPPFEHPYYQRFPSTGYDIYRPQKMPTDMYHPPQHPGVYGYTGQESFNTPLMRPTLYPSTSNGAFHPHGEYTSNYATPVQPMSIPYSQPILNNVYPPTSVGHCVNTPPNVPISKSNSVIYASGDNLKEGDLEMRRHIPINNMEPPSGVNSQQTFVRNYKRAGNKGEISSHGSSVHSSTTSELSCSDSVKNRRKDSSDSSSNKGDENLITEKGFFIPLGDDKPKPKPTLRQRPKVQRKFGSREGTETCDNENLNNAKRDQEPKRADVERDSSKTFISPHPPTPGVGFVIGQDLVNPDPHSEMEMAKKKEMIMLQSMRRKQEQECKRILKEQELARKKEEERCRKEEMERKKEEEKLRRQMILEQYRQRKCQEEADKNGLSGTASTTSSNSSRNNTVVLHRQMRGRPSSGGNKPRPKSYHVSASQMQDYASLDPKASRITDDIDSTYTYNSSMSSGGVNSCSRPQSALSGNSVAHRRMPSPNSRLPALPPSLMLGRHRGPPSDGASDVGSTFSEYTGPKLFVKPTQKSNRGIIINASNVVLAGAVNNEVKKRVLEEINASDSKHFLILFRGAGMQFRAIYSYNPDREEVLKLYGTGPKTVNNDMIDKFYK
ncbi:calmodulin-regulated spectrin-associated protein 2-like protein [Dinothrombium tinctorium]|uniref:Calmodulin-regulated spectrin-associated protein 2-like protein n=1 Tax=Dinothrombium tinctorium TaxID=1965070 RepID=A0A443RE44_9ACAR|nr:calmodulin-regulated spectrin-associated protein 2-like protein [Dinothrombium tinctorium]